MRDFSKVKVTAKNIAIMGAKINRREAALCAVLSYLDEAGDLDNVIEGIDWDEASACANGEWLLGWFEKHTKTDTTRREATKAAALAKLTTAERKALGLD
jgi:hypothetical protein